MMKLMLVCGTRSNIIKMAPLYFELKKHPEKFEVTVVHTGQHYDHNMSQIFFEQFGLPGPDYSLGIGSGTHGWHLGATLIKMENTLIKENPDMLVIFEDADSALGSALAASKMNIPIVHVEAGVRVYDNSITEEKNRKIIDSVSHICFTTSDGDNLHLIKEGLDINRIFLVGSLMIDTLKNFMPQIEQNDILECLELVNQDYLLLTVHHPEIVDDPENLKKLNDIITQVAERIKVVFPMHPRTSRIMRSSDACASIMNNLNVKTIDPCGYMEFIKLEKNARLILTDSGGVQQEAAWLRVPCLTLSNSTPHQVTISDGTNKVTGLNRDKVIQQLEFILQNGLTNNKRPIMWDGQTAERIVRLLDENFNKEEDIQPESDQMPTRQYAISSSGL
ncbi:MAG: UDP-N-acetylglucosamine 2-epimerase (non-hydrolyzing) [candidate division Zixibacteria bacterium]|nr:UDP-N-acetylglucosamine 2-epimerase (non-hydrolyzing) [candidate division Zixibacteria bacterium]